jgi:hypothetical protein
VQLGYARAFQATALELCGRAPLRVRYHRST